MASTIVRPAVAGLDGLADDVGRLRVQGRGGLVEEDDRRIVEQGPGDRELLLHALAERAGDVVAPLPEREQAQVAFDALGAGGGVEVVQATEELEVVARRQLVVEARRLGQDADPRPDSVRLLADVEALDRRRALARGDERGEHPDRRRLAGPVGSQQAQDLAPRDRQIHVADRPQVPKSATEAGRPEA